MCRQSSTHPIPHSTTPFRIARPLEYIEEAMSVNATIEPWCALDLLPGLFTLFWVSNRVWNDLCRFFRPRRMLHHLSRKKKRHHLVWFYVVWIMNCCFANVWLKFSRIIYVFQNKIPDKHFEAKQSITDPLITPFAGSNKGSLWPKNDVSAGTGVETRREKRGREKKEKRKTED